MDFKHTLRAFLDSEILVYALYVYLFALIFYIIYSALNYFKYYSQMQRKITQLYSRMSDQEKARAQAERQRRDIYGESTKRDWLARLDEELAYSGIKEKIKWMTTELYIIIEVIFLALVITIVTTLTNVWYGVVSLALAFIALKLVLSLTIYQRNKKTEAIMLQFMNIIDNFSKTSDDLITIIEKSSRYIEEPLSTQIYDAVIEAKNTGDTLSALQQLQDRVKNKHFKVLIKNLEITSRYESNYSEIIEDCRELFHDYLRTEKEKRTIRINGLLEIGAMLFFGFFSLFVLGQVTEQGNIITVLMNGGMTGRILLIYLAVTIIASCYVAVFQVFKTRN